MSHDLLSEDQFVRRVRALVLDTFCAVPTLIEGDNRSFNEDISEMSLIERRAETERVRLRLLLDPMPCRWLLDRLIALEGVREQTYADEK